MTILSYSRPNILVAEDDAKLRELLLEGLADFGFEPSAAPSGRTALERIRERKPDLLLCDVLMPDGDGHDVLRAIRADRQLADLPVIFLSALTCVADVRAGMNLGADDYLVKPVVLSELRRAVQVRLARAKLLRRSMLTQPAPAAVRPATCGRTPSPWPDLPSVPGGCESAAADGRARVDAARANGLAWALGQAEQRTTDLLVMVQPGLVRCPQGDFDSVVGALLVHAIQHTRPGDAIWLVGEWDGSGYQMTLWTREVGGDWSGANPPGALTGLVEDLGLGRMAAALRPHGCELRLQDCGPDGVRFHLHFQHVFPTP